MNNSLMNHHGAAHHSNERVCLMIDFENLVYGLSETVGDDRLADELNVNLVFGLAEEYGHVVVANAYADWRSRMVNQFQVDLYKLGIDLVHVVGKKGKNAVDVKMAVDAVEMLFTLPHIDTFVIVSGDRDFIHVLKALRRRGKKIIGVAPAIATSEDFAALCDRFLRYSALARSGESDAQMMDELRGALKRILSHYAEEGIKGARMKPLLRREVSPTFDESEYGFARMSQLLRSFPDEVRVVEPPGSDGDIVCYPAGGGPGPAELAASAAEVDRDALIRDIGLSAYRYEVDVEARRRLLKEIYELMAERETFSWSEICDAVLEYSRIPGLSIKILSGYHAILRQTKTFMTLPDQDGDLPLKERKMELVSEITDFESFFRQYESGVVHKLVAKLGDEASEEQAAAILGLEDDEAALDYADDLIEEVRDSLEDRVAAG